MTMRHLFDDHGLQALAALMRERPLLAFDFDGTLAPIVDRPDDAAVPPAVAEPLAALAERLPVAVVTGRSVRDVASRLGVAPHYLVGNHGAEAAGHAVDAAGGAALDDLRARLAAADLAGAGVQVEDKGLSLALHYRLAADRQAAETRIDAALTPLDPLLARFGGKLVVNVVVAAAPDKGDAVLGLAERAGTRAVLFIGDDLNDEAVFRRAPPDWLTVRVGRDQDSVARYFVDGQADMAQLLQKMLALIPHAAVAAAPAEAPSAPA